MSAGLADLGGHGVADGRGAARLHGLDSFACALPEFVVPRAHRMFSTDAAVCSTGRPLTRADIVTVQGFRCVTAERLILDTPLFGFTKAETENAIDSSIRLRLVAEQRLRTRVVREHCSGMNGSRQLLDALVDAGGESRLERWFLRLVRQAGITRPPSRRSFATKHAPSPASTPTFPAAWWSKCPATALTPRVNNCKPTPNGAQSSPCEVSVS
jgi:hypothetical protein